MRLIITDRIRLNQLFEYSCYLLLLLFTFGRIAGPGYWYVQIFMIGYSVAVFTPLIVSTIKSIRGKHAFLIVIVMLSPILNKLFINSISIIEMGVYWVAIFGCGMYFFYAEQLNTRLASVLYIFSSVALIIINHSNSDTYYLFDGILSRNYISIYLGIWLFVVVFAYDKKQGKPPFLIYVLYFVSSVLSVGRMGIACSGLLLFLVVVNRFVNPSKIFTKRMIIRLVVLFVVIIVAGFVLDNKYYTLIEDIFYRFFDPGNAGSNNERKAMLIQYFNAMLGDAKAFFLGLKTNNISPNYYHHNGNTHNSYLMIHARSGIVSLVIIVITMVYAVLYSYNSKRKDLSFVIIAIMLRALTDRFMIGDIGDIFVAYCLFCTAEYFGVNKGRERRL